MGMIFGITRVRDESLIIVDTIRHFLSYCDHIILYDDCSNDDTPKLAQRAGGEHITIIRGDFWVSNRRAEETRHRALLLQRAREMGAEWCLCFDADERLVGDLPPLEADGYRFRLFDGYLTKERQMAYISATHLYQMPRMWGPEYRDILMLFRADRVYYHGLDRREPFMFGAGQVVQADVVVRHYGKCMSVEQWEETCEYYATHFPEPYRTKWNNRRGKAIHTKSDFGRGLYVWEDLMLSPQIWRKI